MIYEQMEPFGERGAYLRNGIVTAMLYNVNRGTGEEAANPEDFMPELMVRGRSKPEPVSPLFELARIFGATIQPEENDEHDS
jgi:hypothetical protein